MGGEHAQAALVTTEQQELEAVLVQGGASALLVHAPDLGGDGGDHPGVGAVLPRAGEGQKRPVLLEQEAGVDPVGVGLGQHRGQGPGLQHYNLSGKGSNDLIKYHEHVKSFPYIFMISF